MCRKKNPITFSHGCTYTCTILEFQLNNKAKQRHVLTNWKTITLRGMEEHYDIITTIWQVTVFQRKCIITQHTVKIKPVCQTQIGRTIWQMMKYYNIFGVPLGRPKRYGHITTSSIFHWSLTHPLSAAYIRQSIGSALIQIMACRLFGTNLLSKPMLVYCQLDHSEQISVKF